MPQIPLLSSESVSLLSGTVAVQQPYFSKDQRGFPKTKDLFSLLKPQSRVILFFSALAVADAAQNRLFRAITTASPEYLPDLQFSSSTARMHPQLCELSGHLPRARRYCTVFIVYCIMIVDTDLYKLFLPLP